MSEYSELVTRLREDAEWAEANEWETPIMLSDNLKHAADAIENLQGQLSVYREGTKVRLVKNDDGTEEVRFENQWIPVTERLPECDLGAEVGNIEWICCGMVHAGCFGRGGKYRDAYFRTWTDAGEGMGAKDADYWRAVTLPEPPKEET